ncbi:MAG TPA: hypothetical protein VLN59_17415 [Burkholderiales bacterium]|nr:hypothetical protein [Burkholderiales bacterium]
MINRIGTTLLLAASLLLAACGDIHSRTEFTTMVMNKSEEEVKSTAGKPAEIDASNPDHVVWIYKLETFDIDHGNKRDEKTLVIFERKGSGDKLRVTDVKFG